MSLFYEFEYDKVGCMNKNEIYMRTAIKLALKSYTNNEVPVGAVVVKDDVIIGTGNNQTESKRNSLYHAELIAIDNACRKIGSWRLTDCTIFVTLEPCMMCAGAILNSRISKIVFGAKNNSCGALKYILDKIEIIGGIYNKECSSLIASFFKSKRI